MVATVLSASALAIAAYRLIVNRCRELRWFSEQGWPAPKPNPEKI